MSRLCAALIWFHFCMRSEVAVSEVSWSVFVILIAATVLSGYDVVPILARRRGAVCDSGILVSASIRSRWAKRVSNSSL